MDPWDLNALCQLQLTTIHWTFPIMFATLLLAHFGQAQYTGFFGHPSSGLCLTSTGPTVNSAVQLQACTDGNQLQSWIWAGDSYLKSVGGASLCFAPQSVTSGAPLFILACSTLVPKFKWKEKDGPDSSLILMNNGDDSYCLSVENTAPGSAVIMSKCDASAIQNWVQGIPGGNIVPPDVPPHGLSWGTIALIALFGLALVYLLAGCIFQRKVKGVSSLRESFPNHELWMDLPKLVKDGALFTVRKIRDCFARCRGKPTADYETI